MSESNHHASKKECPVFMCEQFSCDTSLAMTQGTIRCWPLRRYFRQCPNEPAEELPPRSYPNLNKRNENMEALEEFIVRARQADAPLETYNNYLMAIRSVAGSLLEVGLPEGRESQDSVRSFLQLLRQCQERALEAVDNHYHATETQQKKGETKTEERSETEKLSNSTAVQRTDFKFRQPLIMTSALAFEYEQKAKELNSAKAQLATLKNTEVSTKDDLKLLRHTMENVDILTGVVQRLKAQILPSNTQPEFIHWDSKKLAESLTSMACLHLSTLYSNARHASDSELKSLWMTEILYEHDKRQQNVIRILEDFSRFLRHLVMKEVLQAALVSSSNGTARIAHFLALAMHLHRFRNYNDCSAVVLALMHPYVQQVKCWNNLASQEKSNWLRLSQLFQRFPSPKKAGKKQEQCPEYSTLEEYASYKADITSKINELRVYADALYSQAPDSSTTEPWKLIIVPWLRPLANDLQYLCKDVPMDSITVPLHREVNYSVLERLFPSESKGPLEIVMKTLTHCAYYPSIRVSSSQQKKKVVVPSDLTLDLRSIRRDLVVEHFLVTREYIPSQSLRELARQIIKPWLDELNNVEESDMEEVQIEALIQEVQQTSFPVETANEVSEPDVSSSVTESSTDDDDSEDIYGDVLP